MKKTENHGEVATNKLNKINENITLDNKKVKKEVSILEIKKTEELKLKKAFQIEKRNAEKIKTQFDAIRISNGVLEKKIEKLEKITET